jgi:ADP-heptose:LPS heptosyltransferase
MERERLTIVLNCEGLGDCLYAIPVIKKIHALKAHQYVLDVLTCHPELFAACPWIDRAGPISDLMALKGDLKALTMFDPSKLPHGLMDTFDFLSVPVGLGTLSFREKQLEYFPVEADAAERFDVVLNTSMTWPTRSWALSNWQRLADVLTGHGYSVAVVGKDIHSPADRMDKISHPLAGCRNLANRLSLDQTYYTIAKSGLFVSCQNGLSVLAGATRTEIVVLGMAIEWSKRAIYRDENPHHAVTYARGDCPIHCGKAFECADPTGGATFRCVPSYETVEAVVLDRLRGRRPVGCTARAIDAAS